MGLTKEDIEKFKEMYKEHYDEELNDFVAYEAANHLVQMVKLVYKPITKEQYNKFEKEQRVVPEEDKIDFVKHLVKDAKVTEFKEKIGEKKFWDLVRRANTMDRDISKIIKDEDLGFPHKEGIDYKKRKAVRAVVFDNENKIALLNVAKHNYHKLPGGGVEDRESLPEALNRETLEEIGCKVKIISEVGKIIEFRDEFEEEQESLCYLAKVVGEKGESNFTAKEASQGFNVLWVEVNEAVKILNEDMPNNYEGKFIKTRDTFLLNKAIEILRISK